MKSPSPRTSAYPQYCAKDILTAQTHSKRGRRGSRRCSCARGAARTGTAGKMGGARGPHGCPASLPTVTARPPRRGRGGPPPQTPTWRGRRGSWRCSGARGGTRVGRAGKLGGARGPPRWGVQPSQRPPRDHRTEAAAARRNKPTPREVAGGPGDALGAGPARA